ncbi:hypothetical protein NP493_545g00049 [Ridgeia piscesae]|uniref:Uncharacterized protein n=1 Tax=Ridgeia piscesae TaxID=27915 RepID=A0AAD9NT36_RIDPI|nr:hypothetical protein NP493_545g00049 [Ridgeia piscesae]
MERENPRPSASLPVFVQKARSASAIRIPAATDALEVGQCDSEPVG